MMGGQQRRRPEMVHPLRPQYVPGWPLSQSVVSLRGSTVSSLRNPFFLRATKSFVGITGPGNICVGLQSSCVAFATDGWEDPKHALGVDPGLHRKAGGSLYRVINRIIMKVPLADESPS